MKQLEQEWIKFYMESALHYASKSKDPRTKVGAIVVSEDNRQVASGFNGFVANVPDMKDWYIDKEIKQNFVCHAERNALDGCLVDLTSSILYTTHFPCSSCAISICNRKIKHVVTFNPEVDFFEKYGGYYTMTMFNFNSIELITIDKQYKIIPFHIESNT